MDLVMFTTALLRPSAIRKPALALSIGGALGGFSLSILAQYLGSEKLSILHGIHSSSEVEQLFLKMHSILLQNPYLILTAAVISPIPLTPLILVAAISGISPITLTFAVFSGRLLKYLVFGKLASSISKRFKLIKT